MKSPLRQVREGRGQTIVEVCRAVGTDPGNLSRVENGKQKASTELAEKLAKHFDNEITEMQILYPERFSPLDEAEEPPQADITEPDPADRPRRNLPNGKNVMSISTDQPHTYEVKK